MMQNGRITLSLHIYIIILTILCRLKIVECRKAEMYDIGFINTNLIDEFTVKFHAKETEDNLLRSLVINQNNDTKLFPYNYK